MRYYLKRNIEEELKFSLEHFPVVAVLGPRQCGKSTLIKELSKNTEEFLYIDLQDFDNIEKLKEPSLFFKHNKNKTICLDEIQYRPELFNVLRSIIDSDRRNGRFIILGSASRDLIKQSSESLAGRISYIELTPFLFSEINEHIKEPLISLWYNGGFPESVLPENIIAGYKWRESFIRSFLERDIPQLGFYIPPAVIGRLWKMCAHLHGQVLNYSKLGESLGVNHKTVKSYIDILSQTFMVRILPAYHNNIGKRLVKSPKLYIRDTGILTSLLSIKDFNDLMGHPVFGESWEGMVIENILSELPDREGYFYRTSKGAEIDLVLERGMTRVAVECKASSAPSVSKGFYIAMDDLKIEEGYIIAPVKEEYPVKKNVWVVPLKVFIDKFKGIK
ncbi:MAG: ATP-binding protein [Candidatus Delongbacteria bacterium]|nr:ATP-binding protein [Candidatus Delongbacteria bacterium]